MSVGAWRDAAAQRTAARPYWRRLASWLVIVPVLGFFSFTVVAGAAVGGKPDYAAAAKQLPPGKPLVVVAASGSQDRSLLDRLTHQYSTQVLCSVTASQVATLSARYQVGRMTIRINGASVVIITVSGITETELRKVLNVSKLQCTLVRVSTTFYLPFDAHGS